LHSGQRQVNSLHGRGSGGGQILEVMDALIALVGGSVGAVLTLLFRVPGGIRNHNRMVREVDDGLTQWVSDDCVVLERELRGRMNTAGHQLYSGSYRTGIAHSKEEALHRYRDQERQALAKVGEWRDAEGFLHRCLRRFPGADAFPTLNTPEKAEPILAGWREGVSRDGTPAPVSDPTKRSLEWAIQKYGQDAKPWDRFVPS
jgi:hypothetical protein